MQNLSIDSVFIRMVLEGLDRQQFDAKPLLLKHGLSPISLQKPSYPIKLDQFAAFIFDAMLENNDEFLGLGQKAQPMGSFAMACRASISARNIGRSLKRYANFWNLFEHTFQHSVQQDEQLSVYRIDSLGNGPLNNYLVEACLSTVHRFHCWLGGQFIPILSVSMRCSEPTYAEALGPLFYGAPVLYNQNQNSIHFPNTAISNEVVQTPETLDQYLSGKNSSLLFQAKNYRALSEQVRQWLERALQNSDQQTTLHEAAKYFAMSQQVLHRRLQVEGHSFKEIKQQTRRDIAVNLLFDEMLKVEAIASQVGFSEPSAFIRAFKSWTGSTPLAYRRDMRQTEHQTT